MDFSGLFRLNRVPSFARQLANGLRRRHRRFNALTLVAIVLFAIAIRFWHLGSKALWLDEWLTLFIANGYGSAELPLDRLLSFRDLTAIVTPHPDASPAQVMDILRQESTHPPLFFLLQHYGLRWQNAIAPGALLDPFELPTILRRLPACLGIAQVILIGWVGQLAFSPPIGLLAAALTATSPLMVYLSQEARHYTLMVLCVTVALGGLLLVVKRWQYGDLRACKAVVLWIFANTVGLYSHYLFVLAFVAQGAAIALWLLHTQQWRRRRRCLTAIVPGFGVPLLLFSPELWRLVTQVQRSETVWAQPFNVHWSDSLAPIGQTLVALLSAFAALPIEGQPLAAIVPLALVLLLFGSLLAALVVQGWRRVQRLAAHSPESARLHERRRIVAIVVLVCIGQMLAAFYLLGKDLTVAPRYHSVYYPGLCLLVAIGLGGHSADRPPLSGALRDLPHWGTHWRRTLVLSTIAIGAIGAICVTQNLAFQKGYRPRDIATHIQSASGDRPTLTIAAYENLQEVALGWSILWELGRRDADRARFAFLDRTQGYDPIWNTLASGLPAIAAAGHDPDDPDRTLWILAPGLRQAEFPPTLAIADQRCTLDPEQYHRLGIPYQGYRCTHSIQSQTAIVPTSLR